MKITQALLGEHGAIYPLLDLIERTASTAGLAEIRTQARFLRATLVSHADIEDELLRPVIFRYLPPPAPSPDGTIPPTDHQRIGQALESVSEAADPERARQELIEAVAIIRKHFEKGAATLERRPSGCRSVS
jgi:Hemerythrin HHE cation binding domain